MLVKHAGAEFVLRGAPLTVVPGQSEQPALLYLPVAGVEPCRVPLHIGFPFPALAA